MKHPFIREDVSFCWAGPDDEPGALFAAELLLVTNAVEKRKREFSLGRFCARSALRKLGVGEQPIERGSLGEPLWPAGIVGSISHSQGHAFAAAAFQGSKHFSIGVDLEPCVALPEGLLWMVLSEPELKKLAAYPEYDRPAGLLLFSAKEAIYKAWCPITAVRVGFQDCEVEWDFESMTFVGRIRAAGQDLSFDGQWFFPSELDGFVLTTAEISV